MKVLDKQLEPIRQRRHEFEKDIPEVFNILKKGTDAAREVAAQTLHEVRQAMRINYFDDLSLIQQQAEKYQ
jgi:tryptophanyl-tRNA synthetase